MQILFPTRTDKYDVSEKPEQVKIKLEVKKNYNLEIYESEFSKVTIKLKIKNTTDRYYKIVKTPNGWTVKASKSTECMVF